MRINKGMNIPFTKMHGLGNDFVVLDARIHSVPNTPDFYRYVAHRHLGVGCDQVIVLRPSPNADIFMDIYNQDGSRVGACGNATRCVASVVMDENQTPECSIETLGGILQCVRNTDFADDFISINMGDYKTDWADIPVSHAMDTTHVAIDMDGTTYTGACVHMGNPHFVCIVDDCHCIDVPVVGQYIENHPIFPERTNVEFIHVLSPNHIRMRVWERGGMMTLACGSGACAAAVACHRQGLCEDTVRMTLDGGDLYIRIVGSQVHMIGPYETVFTGEGVFHG